MHNAPQLGSLTPILDSATIPKRNRKTFASIAIGFLISIPLSAILILVSNDARRIWNGPACYVFPTYILSILMAIVFHEMGHLAAGWLVGFRFSSITIGPISLGLEYGRLKLQLRAVLAGGYAGMHVERLGRLRQRLRVFIAGGPIANLVTAVLCASLLIYRPPESTVMAITLEMLWMISAIFAILNLVPYRVGVLYNDGFRILTLRVSPAKARRWICHCAIANQSQSGVRARMWKRTWLDAVGRIRDGSCDDFSGSWLAYLAANDRKDSATAAAHLERCLELTSGLGPSLQDLVALEAATFSAWFPENPNTSQAVAARGQKDSVAPEVAARQGRNPLALRPKGVWIRTFSLGENFCINRRPTTYANQIKAYRRFPRIA